MKCCKCQADCLYFGGGKCPQYRSQYMDLKYISLLFMTTTRKAISDEALLTGYQRQKQEGLIAHL